MCSKECLIYIVLNKFIGIICMMECDVLGNIVDFIGYYKCIFLIGCLDKLFDGLIFLINDGDIVNKILCVGNNYEKEYVVWVDKFIMFEFIC